MQVHAPPGGSTTIDLGGAGYERPKPLVQVQEPLVQPPAPPVEVVETVAAGALLLLLYFSENCYSL